ncbi:MAG: NADH-quinone oxidoreductase subunit NuoN [Campylobacteraceae bacterium]|jgi:NADH-quinone oxidoreductase subunit N|nr:NADH-quinone oxidoreductase subunit NuoN [Campylobacteraceae bacterium]
MQDTISLITLESLNLSTLLPMIVLCVGALFIMCADMLKKELGRNFYIWATMLFLSLSLGFAAFGEKNESGFFGMMTIDSIAKLSQIVILAASLLFVPLSLCKKEFSEHRFAEYFTLLLFAVVGFLFMASTTNIILIFIGLETASLCLYTMIAMHNRTKAVEAALKYFTMGALASGFYAFGAMMLYALGASADINEIFTNLAKKEFEPLLGVAGALAVMLGAIGFKLALIPFHTWMPDVYEGSPAPLAGYISIAPKVAAFAVTVRIFEPFIAENILWAESMFYILSVVTMTLANLMALVQTDVKRMLAFSSMSHAAFILCAVLVSNEQTNSAIFVYWILFMFANMGAFALLWAARNDTNLYDVRFQHPFVKFSGLIKTAPVTAMLMALFMFSLAGIPPFSVFWGKIYIMSAVINKGYIFLAVIMALNSAIAVYYYIKLIVYMFLTKPSEIDGKIYAQNASLTLSVVVAISAAVTLGAVLLAEPVMRLTHYWTL